MHKLVTTITSHSTYATLMYNECFRKRFDMHLQPTGKTFPAPTLNMVSKNFIFNSNTLT